METGNISSSAKSKLRAPCSGHAVLHALARALAGTCASINPIDSSLHLVVSVNLNVPVSPGYMVVTSTVYSRGAIQPSTMRAFVPLPPSWFSLFSRGNSRFGPTSSIRYRYGCVSAATSMATNLGASTENVYKWAARSPRISELQPSFHVPVISVSPTMTPRGVSHAGGTCRCRLRTGFDPNFWCATTTLANPTINAVTRTATRRNRGRRARAGAKAVKTITTTRLASTASAAERVVLK